MNKTKTNEIVNIYVEGFKHSSNMWSFLAVSGESIKIMGAIPDSSALFKTNLDGNDILIKDNERVFLKDGNRFYGVPHIINAS